MKRFSQRIGAVQATTVIQLESVSEPLRNSLWNFILSLFDEGDSGWYRITEVSAQFFFKTPVDELPLHNYRRQEWLKKLFYHLPWYEVYDYVEFIVQWYERVRRPQRYRRDQLRAVINRIFEEEMSGYRFVGEELAPISTPSEVEAIASALAVTDRNALTGAHEHLEAALKLLAKRPDPDYRNSVKESISAVEAVAKQFGSSSSQGLSGALTELGKKMPIHGGLRSGLLSLYGYTSDEGGIRHAMLDESTVGYDEAKYMVVVCSAFVHFLASKAEASGLTRAKE
jgi:hypothetical protein